ncbi:MAG: hypothetical protein O2894_03440 [Planctomycetota bacterium]|nr:hypothetical protein [Planctomycetota bacterium]
MPAGRSKSASPKPSRRRSGGRPAHVTVLALLFGLTAVPLAVIGAAILGSVWRHHRPDEQIVGLLGSDATSVPLGLALAAAGALLLVIGIALYARVRWAPAAARGLLFVGLLFTGLAVMYYVAMTGTAFFDSDTVRGAQGIWFSLLAHVSVWAQVLVLRDASVAAWFKRET